MDKTRMGKRVASLLLSLVMMLSLLPTAAYATMADGVDTQGAIVSENGTDVSDDSNSSGGTGDLQVEDSEGNGDTGAQQVGGSSGSGTADDTTGAEGGADPTDSVNGNDSTDPQDDGDAVMPVASSVVSTSEELVAAIAAANDGDTITLGEGEFTTYGNTSPEKSLTFVGAGTGTVWTIGDLDKDVGGEGNGDCSFDGCNTVTFRNMTLKSNGADYRGFIRISNTVVENCTLKGKTAYWGYETAKFEDSTFNAPVGDYALWDYSTKAMTFEGCTFNISGKGVNVYVEQPSTDARTVEVNGCTVNSDKAGKAFLNIKNSTQSYDVTLSGTNTVNGLTADGTTGSALYQVETTKVTETTGNPVTVKAKADDGTVTTLYEVKETVEASVAEVNGAKYKSLQAAVDAAKSGATVTLLADTRENVTVSKNAIVLDLNGHTLNGGTENAKPALTVDNKKVTLKDSSEAQTGTIKREDTADTKTSHYVIDIQGKNGFMIVESGKVENNSGIPGVKGSSLIRLGNDSVSGWPTLTIKGGTFTQDNFIAIKVDRGTLHLLGGTVNSANSFAIENWNNAYIKGGTVNGTVSTWVYSTGAAFSKLEISGGTVNGNVASVNYDNAADKQARVYVTGGTVTGTLGTYTYNNGLVAMDETAKATIEVTGGTFSKDPTQYVVEDSAISKNDDGTYGVAKTYLAKIGDTEYYTMDEAFHAVKAGETIVMLRDYTTNKVQNSGDESFTIDLGGHTWTANIVDTASAAFEINYSDVTLTVKNGKVVSSQLAGLIPSAMSGTITYNNSKLVFDGVEMTANGHSGIETNGSNTNDTVTLKNSTLNVPNGYGIYFPSSGTLTIDNSVINAKTMGVQVCSGSLNISGAGTAITVTGDGIAKTENDGAIEDGAAISIVERTGYKGLIAIKVESGTFTAKAGNDAVKAYKWDNTNKTESAFDNSKNVVAVSGGTFSSEVDKSLCADGFIPTQNEDGTYGVKEGKFVAEVGSTKYETLAEAVAAAEDGQTVTLLADVADCGSLTISKNITLDGGGHTISGNSSISVNMPGNAAADVTIKNVTFKDIANGNKLSAFYFSQVKGKLTITGCTFDSIEYEAIQVTPMEGAEVNVSNNVFRAKADGTQVRHIHIEMAYGSGFDCEGQNIKLTVTDNQLHGAVSGDASMGIWWVGTDSTLKVDGNYMEHPETVSITLANSGVHYNRGDLIYPARSQADVDVDDLMPAVIVADKASGESKINAYNTLADAVAAAQDGQTVRLLADVEQNTQLAIDKSITLDLNGKTIKNTADIWGDNANAILSITKGAKVTITGNGTIDAKENDCYAINMVKGDLTIENGTFYGNVSVVQVQEGTLSVKGGTFDLHQKWEGSSKYLINCIDDAYVGGSANVAISGGTFVGFDPNVSPEQKVDGKTPSFAAPGVGITRNENGSFTAVDGMTAQILDKDGNSVKAYNTLADAVAAAQDGQTVRLLADVTLDAQIATGKAITIDGQSKYTIKAAKKLASADGKAGMFYRTQSAKGTLTFLNVTLDGGGVSKIFLNEGGAGETVFDGVTSTNGGGIAYGSGIHISGGGSHATIRNSTLTGSTGTMELNNANYYAANDLWVGGNVYVTVENSVIGNVFVNSAPSATATNGVVHGQLTITGEKTKITYLSGEEEAADKLDKFGNNGSLVKIDSGYVEKVFDKGSYAISGGTFKTEVKKEWCAAGYVPADNGNGTYGVEVGKFTVMVTSRTTGSNSPVANVTGGGSNITYAQGTKVTASAISGYNFVGWFVNEYTGTPYSTDLTCEVKPTADCTMIAVYEPISGGKFWLNVTASKFTVNGGAVQDSYLYEQFAIGTSVTVKFTGTENFLYWVNASNKVVSTDKSYTFIMGSETTLKAVYGKARQNQATVVFISHSDQIISSKAYTTNDTIQFPVPPIKMGCTFTGWSMTEAEIRAAMANNSGIIQVRARYTEPSIACKVTVIYPDGIGNDVVNAVVGKAINVTAKDIEGKTFSYWTDNAGNVLGYTKTLKLAPSGDMTVKAVYDEAAEAKPVITISEVSATTANESYVVTFMATRAVPDGYKVVKQGILWSRDAVCGEDGAAAYMQFDSNGKLPTGVNAYIGNSLELNGVTRLDITTKYNERTFYGRGYMVLESDAGELLYIYTNTIASGSYDSLTK